MKRLAWFCTWLILAAACGSSQAARQSPGQSPHPSSSAAATATTSATPAELTAGRPAWVAVAVAAGWRSPSSARPVDAPALENPVRIAAWLDGMSAGDKVGLIGRLDTQTLLGDEVVVLQVSGAWAQVAVPDQATPLDTRGYPVWMPVRQLSAAPPPDSEQSVTVTSPRAVLRSGAGSLEVSFGTSLPMVGTDGASFRVGLPGGAVMTIDQSAVTTGRLAPAAGSIIAEARAFIGLPYLWGGTSGFGFDCSGLVHLLYKAHGVVLPRDADAQSTVGVAVTRSDLRPGDLIYFSSQGSVFHVVIYSGAGNVIDSPSPGYPVEEIPLASLSIVNDFSGARRVIETAPEPTPSPLPLPASLSGPEWTVLPTTDKVVALTFDAGGNDAGVASILKTLGTAGVPATFFLTGRWTEAYPADARAIAADYGIGNHTYSHPHLTSLSDAQVADEITHAQSVIEAATGDDPRPLFRFPYGSADARVLADAHALGYGGIRWTVDTLGWEGGSNGQSQATVAQRVLGALRPGEIVLMHVGAATDGTTLDASALPSIINELETRGYRMVAIRDYVS